MESINNNQDDNENKDQKTLWNPAILSLVLPFVETMATKFSDYLNQKSVKENEYAEATAKHDRRVITILLLFLGAIIFAMVWLTAEGKVSGEALLFAIGLIIGYIFALIQRFIYGSQRTVTNGSEEESK